MSKPPVEFIYYVEIIEGERNFRETKEDAERLFRQVDHGDEIYPKLGRVSRYYFENEIKDDES